MAQCKTALTPLLMHWSYCILVLSYWYMVLAWVDQNIHNPTLEGSTMHLEPYKGFILIMLGGNTAHAFMFLQFKIEKSYIFNSVHSECIKIVELNAVVPWVIALIKHTDASRLGDTYMPQWTGSSLVQVRACSSYDLFIMANGNSMTAWVLLMCLTALFIFRHQPV